MAVAGNITAFLKADTVHFETRMHKAAQTGRRTERGLNRAFGNIDRKGTTAFNRLRQSIVLVDGPLGGIGHRFNVLNSAIRGGGFAIAGTVAAMASGILAFRQSINVAEQHERRWLKLNAILKSTGGVVGLTGRQIREFSRELALNTLASVEGVENAAAKLLTFRSIAGETFKETLRLAQDLAATGFGDLQTQVVTLGKALEDPITGLTSLRRVGVVFSATQTEMIRNLAETNRLAEAQALILEGVRKQVGGAGAGEGRGLSGQYDELSQRAEEFWLALDKVTGSSQKTTIVVAGLNRVLRDLTIWLNDDPILKLQGDLTAAEGLLDQRAKSLKATQDQLNFLRDRGAGGERYEDAVRRATDAFEDQKRVVEELREKVNPYRKEEEEAAQRALDFARQQREEAEAAKIRAEEEKARKAAEREAERAAKRERSELEREANRAIEDGLTAAERLAKKLERLNELRREGLLTEEQYQRAVARTHEEHAKAVERSTASAKEDTEALTSTVGDLESKFADAFASAITGSGDFKQAFKSLIDDMIKQLSRLLIKDLFSGFGGGGGGGFLGGLFGGGGGGGGGFFGSIFSGIGSLFGGFFADGGRPPLGKVSVVGERGPELFVPDTAGTVIPNGGLAAMGGPGQTFNVDMRGASVEAVQRLEAFVTRINATLETRAVAAVSDRAERDPRYLSKAKTR